MFNILAEEKIPFAQQAFKNLGDVTLCKGNRLTAEDLKHIDILLIRSGTRVDQTLLEGTPVRFVASPTAGTDHVDKAYLAEKGIPFHHAPGCNADSVAEYVLAALLSIAERKQEALAGKTVGIVGVGNVGGRLAGRLDALGMEVIVNDPPKFEGRSGPDLPFVAVELDALLDRADIVTVHTPLTVMGRHPTHHLISRQELTQMKPDAWLINAARGAVVSNAGLKEALSAGRLGAVVLDVWENEPSVDVELMGLVDIATPHIAGHSYEGKVNGTIQIYDALTSHYKLDGGWDTAKILAPGPEDRLEFQEPISTNLSKRFLHDIVRQMYDIEADDNRFRQSIGMSEPERGAYFLSLRASYPRRRSFSMYRYRRVDIQDSGDQRIAILQALRKGLKVEVV